MLRNLYVDMDGVLVDFNKGVEDWYGIKFTKEENYSWEYDYKKHGIKQQDFWSGLNETFWENLTWTPEGQAIWAMVEPYDPIILTSPPYSGGGINGKVRWIKKHLPKVRKSRRMIFTSLKHLIATEGDLLLDDKNENVDEFKAAGGSAIMVPRLWNRLHGLADSGSEDILYWVEWNLEMFLP